MEYIHPFAVKTADTANHTDNNTQQFMQQQSPNINKLWQEFDGLIQKLMLRFMTVKSVTDSSDITQIDLDDISNHLPLEEVLIGHNTSKYLEENVNISTSDVKKLREVCFAWWHTALKESIKRLPLTHSVLNNLHWLEPGVQQYSMAP